MSNRQIVIKQDIDHLKSNLGEFNKIITNTILLNQSIVSGNGSCRRYGNNTCLISECGTSGTQTRSMICI